MPDKIYLFLTALLILILATHALALGGFLSYGIWWLDLVLHFAGGTWLGVFVFWYLFRHKNYQVGILPASLLVVGLISFAMFAA